MAALTPQTVIVKQGQDKNLVVTMENADDITGWTLVFTLRRNPEATGYLVRKTTGSGITLTDEDVGEFTIALSAAETLALSVGDYFWDVWRTNASAENPLAEGRFEVVKPAYRATDTVEV